MTIEHISDILLEQNLISPDQKAAIIAQHHERKAKLKRVLALKRNDMVSPDSTAHEITPVDIISSMKLKATGDKRGVDGRDHYADHRQ